MMIVLNRYRFDWLSVVMAFIAGCMIGAGVMCEVCTRHVEEKLQELHKHAPPPDEHGNPTWYKPQ